MDSMKANIFSDQGRGQLPSLVNICIKAILMDHGTTRKTLQFVPKDLFESFLVCALIHERRLCVMEIVAQWPYRVLNLRSLMPKLSDTQCRICTNSNPMQIWTYISNLVLMIAAGFREQIKRNGKLQVLDISGLAYSVAGMGICKYKISDENFVTHFLNMFGNENRRSNSTSQKSGPNRVIYMDWVVGRENKKSVFNFLRSGSTGVSIRCRSLNLQHLSEKSMNQILTKIDLEVINTLHFSTRDIFHNGLKVIERLASLSTLDLSYTFYDLLNYEPARWCSIYVELGNTLSKLPNLIHLDLTGNRLSSQLRTVLQHIQKPLLTLEIYFCQLSGVDISYLATSHHAKQFQNLSLGSNDLSKDPDSLFKLLTSCGDTLQFCGLSNTSLGSIEGIANKLAQVSHSMKNLCTLKLDGVKLSVPDQAEIVTSLSLNIPTLKFIHIPIMLSSTSVHNPGDGDVAQDRKCIVVPTRLRSYVIVFSEPDMTRFFEICAKRFRDSEPCGSERELHVLGRRGPHPASAVNECCFRFKF